MKSLILLITLGMTIFSPAQAGIYPAGEIEGIWQGTLRLSGMELGIIFTVSRNQDNTLSATYDVPEQNVKDAPVDKVFFIDRKVRLEIIPIDGVYEGTLTEDGEKIEGQWMQSSMTLPLVMERARTKPKLNRPQEPKEPFPYKVEEVNFRNSEADINLAGILTYPSSEGKYPAVLLLSGSGAQDCDEMVFGHRPFLLLADYLTRRGLAVLRVDDRGVGGSTGNFAKATAKDYTADAMACVAYLKTRQEVNHEMIGLIGHSEGGMIASMVAAQTTEIAFIVLIACPGLAIKEMEYTEKARTLKANGASEELIAKSRVVQESLFEVLDEEIDGQIVQDKFTSIITEYFNGLSEEDKKITGIPEENLKAYIQDQFHRLHSPWFRYYLPFNTATVLQKVTCPVLALNGEKDIQVTPKDNLQAIKKALEAGGNKYYTVKELSNLNHLLQTAKTGDISEYGKIEETMSPTALQIIGDWILELTSQEKAKDKSNFPVLKGPYLGQKPPGTTPEIFAPGIVSKSDYHEHSSPAFSPGGKEVYWSAYCVVDGVENERIFFSQLNGGTWTAPEIVEFTKESDGGCPTFSPDGNRLYFHSWRPYPFSERFEHYNLYYVERSPDGWGEPIKLGPAVNSDKGTWSPFCGTDGSLYFDSEREGVKGTGDIYHSRFVNGTFEEAENLGEGINTKHREFSPCVAPDGSCILFTRYTLKPKGNQIYVSFRKPDGSWDRAVSLGEKINLCKRARFPTFSPDGKYLFFCAFKDRDVEVFWVDAKIIEEFRPEKFK